MLAFIVRRLLWAVLLVFVVTLIVFVMFFVLALGRTRAPRSAAAGSGVGYDAVSHGAHACS